MQACRIFSDTWEPVIGAASAVLSTPRDGEAEIWLYAPVFQENA